jgi:hypothetical protein
MAAASDGSVLLLGTTDGTTVLDGFTLDRSYLASFDAKCHVKWTRSLDGFAEAITSFGTDRFAILIRPSITGLRTLAIDAAGNDIWARDATSSFQFLEYPMLAADAAGSVFVTGISEGTVDFGTGPLPIETANPPAEQFLAKLDSSGNVVYARSFGYNFPTSFTCDGPSLWLSGSFIGGMNVDFDGHVIPYEGDANDGIDDGYLARLSSDDGSFIDGTFEPFWRGFGANACSGIVYSLRGSALDAFSESTLKWTKPLDSSAAIAAVDGDGNAWLGGAVHVSLTSVDADGSLRFSNHWGSDVDENRVSALAITGSGAIAMSGIVCSPVIDFGNGPLAGTMDAASLARADGYFVRFE